MVLEALQLSKADIYVGLIVNGLCTGLGAALGSYLVNNHIVKKTAKAFNRLKKKIKGKTK